MNPHILTVILGIGIFFLFHALICVIWLYLLKRFPNGDLTYRIEQKVSAFKTLQSKLVGTEFEAQASSEITLLLTNAEMVLSEKPPVTAHLQNCLNELETELANLQAQYPVPTKPDSDWPIMV